MVCVIEGANGCGKSTFIKQYCQGYPVFRALKTLDSNTIRKHRLTSVLEADMYIADYLKQTGQNVIFERSPLSAVIYNGLPFEMFEDWIDALPKPVNIIILVSNYLDSVCDCELEKRRLTRGQAELIHKLYWNMDFTGVNAKIYKTDSFDYAKMIIEEDFG